MQKFLPGWNNLKQVETGLDSLIVQAPTSPVHPLGKWVGCSGHVVGHTVLIFQLL